MIIRLPSPASFELGDIPKKSFVMLLFIWYKLTGLIGIEPAYLITALKADMTKAR